MKKNIDICYPAGGFEDIKEFDIREFGDIENPDYPITPEMERSMANLATHRLENAERFAENKEYDIAVDVTKSALWLLEILNKKVTVKKI